MTLYKVMELNQIYIFVVGEFFYLKLFRFISVLER